MDGADFVMQNRMDAAGDGQEVEITQGRQGVSMGQDTSKRGTGKILDQRNAGQEGCRATEMQDSSDTGQEG